MASLDVCCVLCEVKVMNCITWNTSEKTPKDLACVTSFNILWFRKCSSDFTSWLLLFKNQSLLVFPFQSIVYHSHRTSRDSDSLSPASRHFITVTAHHAHRKWKRFRYCCSQAGAVCLRTVSIIIVRTNYPPPKTPLYLTFLCFLQITKAKPKNTCCTLNMCDQIFL